MATTETVNLDSPDDIALADRMNNGRKAVIAELGKRIIGKLSWQHRRRFIHDPAVAAAMVADIKAAEPDHVALTGDLINIALAGEFTLAADWLKLGQLEATARSEAPTVISGATIRLAAPDLSKEYN